MNETEFIAALRKLPLHAGARGLEDDCAVLPVGDETLVLTHDMMAEGTHFRADADMADVAWKLLAANLSDLAAKGAEPIGVLLGHSLGPEDARFLEGLNEGLTTYGVPLLGGDTVATTGTRTYGMTAIGRATAVPVPSRNGARAGDSVYVTGPVGRAMLGYESDPEHLTAFNRPTPRLAEGIAIAPLASAMMDISDGLVGDADKLGLRALAIDHDMAEPVGQRDEITLGVDDDLLHPLGRLFEQTAQKMRLARTRIALHQQAGRKKLLDIELGRLTALHRSHIDSDLQWRHPQFMC